MRTADLQEQLANTNKLVEGLEIDLKKAERKAKEAEDAKNRYATLGRFFSRKVEHGGKPNDRYRHRKSDSASFLRRAGLMGP